MASGRVTINQIKEMKSTGEKIVVLTAYDYPTAKIIDEADVPVILVGDSLGMVVLGYDSTIPVTMDVMIHHTKAVSRGAKHALVVADMPFMSYHASHGEAMHNAARFIQEAGAQTVKLEGGEFMAETIYKLVSSGIPVMGHLGFTPQSVHQFGGYKIQGKTAAAAERMLKDAIALEQAGAFAIVLELVPAPLAKLITQKISIPTIGIGAGPNCDGQVQVVSDLLGLFTDFVPKHSKQYAKLAGTIKSAVADYAREVKEGTFPTSQNSSTMDESLLSGLK